MLEPLNRRPPRRGVTFERGGMTSEAFDARLPVFFFRALILFESGDFQTKRVGRGPVLFGFSLRAK